MSRLYFITLFYLILGVSCIESTQNHSISTNGNTEQSSQENTSTKDIKKTQAPLKFFTLLPTQKLKRRNLFSLSVKANGQLIGREEKLTLAQVAPILKEFVLNWSDAPHYSVNPKQAFIILLQEKNTSDSTYRATYQMLQKIYQEWWERSAQEEFGKAYNDLHINLQKEIIHDIPFQVLNKMPKGLPKIVPPPPPPVIEAIELDEIEEDIEFQEIEEEFEDIEK